MIRAIAACLLLGCSTPYTIDGGAAADAGHDAPPPDVPIRDVGPLPDGFEWARCEDFVDAGAPGGGSCDPATFGTCGDPRVMGCAVTYECDEDTRLIVSPLIC